LIAEQGSKIASLEGKSRDLADLVERLQRDIDASKSSADKSSEKALAISYKLSEAQDSLGYQPTSQFFMLVLFGSDVTLLNVLHAAATPLFPVSSRSHPPLQ
jgi:hypothetical protein